MNCVMCMKLKCLKPVTEATTPAHTACTSVEVPLIFTSDYGLNSQPNFVAPTLYTSSVNAHDIQDVNHIST